VTATGPAPSAVPSPREGILVERIPGPVPSTVGDGLVTLARFDMERYRLVLLTAGSRDGRWRTLPEWADEAGLVGGINAAMYEPDGRASGLLVQGGVERSPDDPRFGGLLAFDPITESDPPFVLVGRDCPGGEPAALRARYRNLVANYRLLGCGGEPIAWVDEHQYSSAAFATDREGRFVLIHASTPYLMRDLARLLADPALGLAQVFYVEGGPKATLLVDDGRGAPLVELEHRAEEPGERPDAPRPLPNVLGLVPRGGPR